MLMLAACAPETAAAPAPSSSAQRTQGQAETIPVAATPASTEANASRAPTGSPMTAPPPPAVQQTGAAGARPAQAVAGAEASKPATPGAGAGGTQQPGAATTPMSMSNAECTQLKSCCSALADNDDRSDCEELALRNDASRCSRASDDLCPATAPTMPTMPSEACTKLSTCCGMLERVPQQRECQETVERANPERCTRQLLRGCPELGPAPEEPACVTLQACCPMLTEPRALEACRRALLEDDRRDCEQASAALCQ